jgi:hypothetical protein
MIINAMAAANDTTKAIRPTNVDVPSSNRCGGAGGSGTASGHEAKSDVARRSWCAVLGKGILGAEGSVSAGLSAEDAGIGSRNRLGAYLL